VKERFVTVIQDPIPPVQTEQPAPRAADAWHVQAIAWALILIGAAIRLRMYLADRSLWRDEASLSLNIIHRSFGGLLHPLDYDQGAPIGFLMIQKLAVTFFGSNEFVLRFWPTLASILVLPLFYRLCRLILSRRGALIALAVLAMSAGNSFYWADAKQYSTDVLATVALLLCAAEAFPAENTRRKITLIVVGAVAIWFSHPAVFVLSGIGVAAVIRWFAQKSRRRAAEVFLLAAVWGASFLANYLLCLRNLAHSDYLQQFWSEKADAFAPMSASIDSLIWYKRHFFELFRYPFAQALEGLVALAFLLGVVLIFHRRKALLAMLLVPMLAALAASAVHQYPFDTRLLLFLVPLTTIAVAAGLDFLCQGSYRLVGILAIILVMISPIVTATQTLMAPPKNCEISDSMRFIAAHRKPGDVFYLSPTAQYGFMYYQSRFGLDGVPVTVGARHLPALDDYAREFDQFAAKRLWVLFEDPYNGDPVREKQFNTEQPIAMDVLDTMGRCVWRTHPFNEYAACYDLTQAPAQPTALSWDR
jgi:uncharacterized membrane protein